MSQGGKLTPNIDQQSTKLLNLTVLQRIDPCIEEILLTATHVTFYEFNIELNQWSRKDVEGSLFVVKRNGQPRFQFIVMNRRSTENLVENLLGDFEYEVQVPYLLYRNAAQEVNGIWFYNSRECEDVANLFSRILNAYSKIPSNIKVSSTKGDFEELEKVPTTAIIEGPLEPPATTSSDVLEDSFMNFFSSSVNMGNAPSSNVGGTNQPYCSQAPLPFSSVAAASAPIPLQISPLPLSPSTSLLFPDGHESPGIGARATNLVKPSSFFPPPSSSSAPVIPRPPPSQAPMATLYHPSIDAQRQYGSPLLQPFPPPNPPPSLTPSAPMPSYNAFISREKVRDALLMLVQDNQFIEMVYQSLMKLQY